MLTAQDKLEIARITEAIDMVHEAGGIVLVNNISIKSMNRETKIADFNLLTSLCLATKTAIGIDLHFLPHYPRYDIPNASAAVMVAMTPDEFRAWRAKHEQDHPQQKTVPVPSYGRAE